MLYSSVWAGLPGQIAAIETFENAYSWGPGGQLVIAGGVINAATIDPGNTPTLELRPGLVLGQRSDGTWINYAATNTDGSEIAAGVLITSVRMTDILTNVAQTRFYGIMVGGPVQAARLLGLDLMARQAMDKFIFDDIPFNYTGNHWFPFRRFQTKTANYQIVATDNFTEFDNTGATGEVDFTLPAIANGYMFGFRVVAGQILKVISNEGANIVAFNNASANNLAFSTGGSEIGGGLLFYSNPAATKWYVTNISAGSNTITVA